MAQHHTTSTSSSEDSASARQRASINLLKARRRQRQRQREDFEQRQKMKKQKQQQDSDSVTLNEFSESSGRSRTLSACSAASCSSGTVAGELPVNNTAVPGDTSVMSSTSTRMSTNITIRPRGYPQAQLQARPRHQRIILQRPPSTLLRYHKKQRDAWERALQTKARMFERDAQPSGPKEAMRFMRLLMGHVRVLDRIVEGSAREVEVEIERGMRRRRRL